MLTWTPADGSALFPPRAATASCWSSLAHVLDLALPKLELMLLVPVGCMAEAKAFVRHVRRQVLNGGWGAFNIAQCHQEAIS